MTKYLLKRLLRGIGSIIIVVAIVMVLIYSALDRKQVFAQDSYWTKIGTNQRTIYEYRKWEEYGYLDYVLYNEWVQELERNGEIDSETRTKAVAIGNTEKKDSETAAEYIKKFSDYYTEKGYTIVRLEAKMMTKTKYMSGGQPYVFAYKNTPLIVRLLKYFTDLVSVDNIHYAQGDVGERKITFTLHDPVYGEDTLAPAIIGNGTKYKYLLYCDDEFPFIHQNLVTLNLGKSYSVNAGIDITSTMADPQGRQLLKEVTFPTGLVEMSADNLHTAKYYEGSREMSPVTAERFTDDYTNVTLFKSGLSKIGYSFVIGIIASAIAYFLGIPIGVLMARNKDKLIDKIGTVCIIFSIAVPSLARIFLMKEIGGKLGLPTTFMMEDVGNVLMYLLPILSIALPSTAGLMRWLRRYMIDQMNSDYVKFARSGGLSEGEIFSKHILKNAAIPIVHGIPGTIFAALVGAIVTERVYVVPGAGNLLTIAINNYDNGVIVGVTLFYSVLSVVAIILGDILMSMVDPRISFTSKAR